MGSASGALPAAGIGVVFADVSPDPGRDVLPPLRRALVPGVAIMLVPPVEGVEICGATVRGPPTGTLKGTPSVAAVKDVTAPPELLTAISPGGFCESR
jgi:hypothetical protein